MECEFSPISFEQRRSRLKTRASSFPPPFSLIYLFIPRQLLCLFAISHFFFFYISNAISAVNVGGSTDGEL